MYKNKEIHIAYIGRLEKEKGIDIIIDCIKKGMHDNRDIVWHICGDGIFLRELQILNEELGIGKNNKINLYGHVGQEKINEILAMTDLVLMPSLFLETFGLVALEALSRGVAVCGFIHGGLGDFIHPSLALDPMDSVNSFFKILDTSEFPILDISDFSYDRWISRLTELTEGVHNILLVNDYIVPVGGAERYVHTLAQALESIGKTVEIFGYSGKINRWIRVYLMFTAPFAFWRGNMLTKKIHQFSPDIIWMHSILRYIGPHGVRAISNTNCKKYITHHDLGLITLKPSYIYHESDIPHGPNLADWMPKKINIFLILSILPKWIIIRLVWNFLSKSTCIHIFPSSWMEPYFHDYITTTSIIYPHVIMMNNP